jgi:transcriptional regulator with XRE-family HTH domain
LINDYRKENAMTCETCQVTMRERKATLKDPYHDDLSGLSNLYLTGITVRTCPQCGAESPLIPRVEALHQELARVLARKPSFLSGEEIRFLRKHAGFPAQQFAALLGVSPEHLSRVENGHTSTLGSSTDRLARAIATIATDGEDAREVLLRIADQVGKTTDTKANAKRLMTLARNRWKAAA